MVDDDAYAHRLEGLRPTGDEARPALPEPTPDQLYLLIFTSGSTGGPKAVRMTQGRAARAASRVGFSSDDVLYSAMPLFHGNALSAAVLPALASGATLALRREVLGLQLPARRAGVRGHLLQQRGTGHRPHRGHPAHRARPRPPAPLRARPGDLGPGQGGLHRAVRRPPHRGVRIERERHRAQAGARPPTRGPGPGQRHATTSPWSTRTPGTELPRAVFDEHGRLTNADACIGELVGRQARSNFEGYYNNPEADAERTRNGWYWSGDLAYRDEDGIFYFAGRTGDWLRVDSENFAAAPVERILARFEGVSGVAVYPVPDPSTGDQVMAALELDARDGLRPRRLHRLPGRPGGPGHQVGAALRAGGVRPAGHRHRQDGQEAAAGAAVGDRRPGLAPGGAERPVRAAGARRPPAPGP